MQAYRVGASAREKRKWKELKENFEPLIAPYLKRIEALEAQVAALSAVAPLAGNDGGEPVKRGPGRPPKS